MNKPKIILAWMQGDQVELPLVKEMIESCISIVDVIVFQYNGGNIEYGKQLENMIADIPKRRPYLGYEHPWEDFATNRNDLITFCNEEYPRMEYILMMDADETLSIEKELPFLNKDAYDVPVSGDLEFNRRILFRNNSRFLFVGACHEYLECQSNCTIGSMKDILAINLRPKIGNAHIIRNATILSKELEDKFLNDFTKSRYLFYLGQSYFDLKYYIPAIQILRKRIDMGGWEQEQYICYLQIGKSYQELWKQSQNKDYYRKALDAFLNAINIDEKRIEAYYYFIKCCIDAEDPEENKRAFSFFQANVEKYSWEPSGLFIEKTIYEYLFDFWIAILFWRTQNPLQALSYASNVYHNSTIDLATWAQNYDNMWYYFGFDKMSNEQFAEFVKKHIEDETFFLPGRVKEFVFEMPKDYDGLGDHLLFSWMPAVLHQLGIIFKYSEFSQCKTPGTYELVWQSNPYVGKSVKMHGHSIMVIIREMLQRRLVLPEYEDFPHMVSAFLGFKDQLPDHPSIMVTLDESKVSKEYKETGWDKYFLFDGNSKSTSYDQSMKDNVIHSVHFNRTCPALKIKSFDTGNYIEIGKDIPSIIKGSIFDYAYAIKNCKKFFCLHSGGAQLAIGLSKKPNVFIPKDIKDNSFLFPHSANYIKV